MGFAGQEVQAVVVKERGVLGDGFLPKDEGDLALLGVNEKRLLL